MAASRDGPGIVSYWHLKSKQHTSPIIFCEAGSMSFLTKGFLIYVQMHALFFSMAAQQILIPARVGLRANSMHGLKSRGLAQKVPTGVGDGLGASKVSIMEVAWTLFNTKTRDNNVAKK
ncbi:hypothetical protein C5167_021057 [Papaver somniferum]|uniref:Uncharacterized protein n=1 Tax=Papaver somniferum TaxID=3469 RepID=A0A4Y7IV95_PAPSO|nr:hypothetical protein C5167_021057 [Papaver somniferum]